MTTTNVAFEVGLRSVPLSEIGWADLTIREVRQLLDEIEGIAGEARHLDAAKLETIVKMIVEDKSLAEISEKTGIPLVEVDGDGNERRILREEVTSFGTWLGQRDSTLKEVPASEIYLPDDLKGCANAKRNIVVAYQRGDLTVGTYADYLDQRYATGDVTFRRYVIPTMAYMVHLRGGYGCLARFAYEAIVESNGVPGTMWSRAIDIVLTAYENLVDAESKLSRGLQERNVDAVDEALTAAAWVNQARVRTIREAAKLMAEGNKNAGVRLSQQINAFAAELRELIADGENEFLEKIRAGGLMKPFLDVYVPEDNGSQEKEAREWLRGRGLARQTPHLLSHVIWAMTNGEMALLEECLEARAAGSRTWEVPLLEAQLSDY